MRNLKPVVALLLTAIGSAFVATFQVAEPPVIGASTTATTTSVAPTAATAARPTATGAASTATSSPAATGATTPTTGATTPATAAATATPATPAATASPATPTATALFADGSYSGSAIREPWGAFQVEATIAGGKLVNVTVIDAPTDNHSRRINNSAVPVLTQAAVAAQSARVDTISGATWTSESYVTSLQAALDAAQAAATTTQVGA